VSEIAIVGDVHGHPGPLTALLEVLVGQADLFVFLGDYVDRGPGSAEVIEVLLELADQVPCAFLAGNHDNAFRRALGGEFDRFLALGGAATVRSYVEPPYQDVEREFISAVPPSHRAFLEGLAPRFENSELVVEHMLPQDDGTNRFRVGGHAPQTGSVPFVGEDYACIDTGCGTLPRGTLTGFLWPSRSWRSVPT